MLFQCYHRLPKTSTRHLCLYCVAVCPLVHPCSNFWGNYRLHCCSYLYGNVTAIECQCHPPPFFSQLQHESIASQSADPYVCFMIHKHPLNDLPQKKLMVAGVFVPIPPDTFSESLMEGYCNCKETFLKVKYFIKDNTANWQSVVHGGRCFCRMWLLL